MFQRFFNGKTSAVNVTCAVLMIILLVMQFTPFWQYGEAGESCSIGGYVWFPSDNKALESWIVGQVEGFDLNGFVLMPILVLLLSALGAALCLIKPDKGGMALFPTACGAVGACGYLTNAALKLGSGWAWHLLICIALLTLGAYGLMQWVKEMRG